MSMRIARLSYSCRASKRRAIEERKQVWQQELIEAMRTKEFAVGWRLARLLAGTGCGPKKRRYAAAMKARPSKEEWERALAKPGAERGCSAQNVDWEQEIKEHVKRDEKTTAIMGGPSATERHSGT
mmetsp:Transcript_69844/g.197906  ORF Transcript_69844/g.197906 Transcript_69844/m.197906 type:complete len:126 (-) Transcript_69844:1893-2270(-)